MAPRQGPKRRCHCTSNCGTRLSYRTRCRHYKRVREEGVNCFAPSSTISEASEAEEEAMQHSSSRSKDEASDESIGAATQEEGASYVSGGHSRGDENNAQQNISNTTVIDDSSDSNSSTSESSLPSSRYPSPEPAHIPAELVYGDLPDPLEPAMAAHPEEDDRARLIREVGEELVERLENEAARAHDITELLPLTQEQQDDIAAFRLRFLANVSRATYDKFREAFRSRIRLNSDWVLLHRIAMLSGLKPEWYECCINSCVCYLGKYAEADSCPIPECREPRRTGAGVARRYFCYIPLIPRLQAFFLSIRLIELMGYRDKFIDEPDRIKDVFSSDHYHTLRRTRVNVDGVDLPHVHFSDPRDIAMALSVDGYLLFKRKRSGPSATPLLLLNYNLPPEVRTHLEHLLCLGVIGGPLAPKHLWSFLIPFEDECARLAHGVRTFDALRREHFLMRSYCIFCLGDIIAIQKLLNFRGVNAVVPCRSCSIHGILTGIPHHNNYYVPLDHPRTAGEPQTRWDPHHLPRRTHDTILQQVQAISEAPTAKYCDELGKHYGIRTDRPDFLGPVVGRRVRSTLDYARSFPWEWMHLFCENNIPNLVAMWMGRWKDLEGRYIIPQKIWEDIAVETRNAMATIPAAFVSVIPDLLLSRDSWTAEIWAFWFMYIAPVVLRRRFLDERYYTHMCDLISIMRATLRLEITRQEVEELRESIISWVERYERYYYQYKASRLNACVLVVHGLLHIVDDILHAGPLWATWTFFMERFCGKLKRSLTSRSLPWANLDRRVINISHASQLAMKYNLEDVLFTSRKERSAGPTEHEISLPGYPLHYLRHPLFANYTLTEEVRRKVGSYLATIIGGKGATHAKNLPIIVAAWGKLRIGEGGDRIRCYIAQRERLGTHERDSSYVRFDGLLLSRQTGQMVPVVQYGKLLAIFEIPLDGHTAAWKELRGSTVLVAYIRPCKTNGEDATEQLTLYQTYRAEIITDLSAVQSVVGRVASRGSWGIVDRSEDLARAVFANHEDSGGRADGTQTDAEDDEDLDDIPDER